MHGEAEATTFGLEAAMSDQPRRTPDCECSVVGLFSNRPTTDTSVSQERTLADLEALRTELDFKIKVDLKQKGDYR